MQNADAPWKLEVKFLTLLLPSVANSAELPDEIKQLDSNIWDTFGVSVKWTWLGGITQMFFAKSLHH